MEVRCVTADDWLRMKQIRLDAVSDPTAVLAFPPSFSSDVSGTPDAVWELAAAENQEGSEIGRQFVGVDDSGWFVGTLNVYRQVSSANESVATVSGVYVKPEWRGTGLVRLLIFEAERWAAVQSLRLCLRVREENFPAICAYLKAGFRFSGRKYETAAGVELEMVSDGHLFLSK